MTDESISQTLDLSHSPSSNFAVRISLYLALTSVVIDASICVSETSSEMNNVAISLGRKSYISMYLELRYIVHFAASSISSTVTDTTTTL